MAASDRNPSSDRPRPDSSRACPRTRCSERLAEEINRAGRHGTPLSCLLVTIGNLEELAREHGSELSEQTLAYVARALASQVRGFDRVGRPSDGELLLVLPGADGPRGEIVARRVLERLRTIKVESDGTRRPLRISVGLAAWQEDVGAEELLEPARAAARARQRRARRRRPLAELLAARAGTAARTCIITDVLSGSELWLLRLMADRGLALLDADTLLIVIEERGELRVAASAGAATMRVRIVPVRGQRARRALPGGRSRQALDRPRGKDAAWLHELGVEVRAALVEPLSLEGQGGGMVIALRTDGGFRDPDREALQAFATSVAQRLVAERSVEIERLRYGMEARERERTRWAREIHDESIQGMGALRLRLANARDIDDPQELREAVDVVLDGLGNEIDGLRHLITELRPAALDDLGLAAALQALARRAQAIDGLDVSIEIDLGPSDGGTAPRRRAREHDLSRRAGGADERQPPRRSDAARS